MDITNASSRSRVAHARGFEVVTALIQLAPLLSPHRAFTTKSPGTDPPQKQRTAPSPDEEQSQEDKKSPSLERLQRRPVHTCAQTPLRCIRQPRRPGAVLRGGRAEFLYPLHAARNLRAQLAQEAARARREVGLGLCSDENLIDERVRQPARRGRLWQLVREACVALESVRSSEFNSKEKQSREARSKSSAAGRSEHGARRKEGK